MNRLILLIFSFCLPTFAFTQRVSCDRINESGQRQIMTKSIDYVIGDAEYGFLLEVFVSNYKTSWCMLISSYTYMSASSEVLLKLGNDEIIHLEVNNVHNGKVYSGGYGLTFGSYTTMVPPSEVDYYTSLYEITPSTLEWIEKYGIVKIRISDGIKFRDREFNGNQLGKQLVKSKKNILKQMEKQLNQPGGLYDNF